MICITSPIIFRFPLKYRERLSSPYTGWPCQSPLWSIQSVRTYANWSGDAKWRWAWSVPFFFCWATLTYFNEYYWIIIMKRLWRYELCSWLLSKWRRRVVWYESWWYRQCSCCFWSWSSTIPDRSLIQRKSHNFLRQQVWSALIIWRWWLSQSKLQSMAIVKINSSQSTLKKFLRVHLSPTMINVIKSSHN